MAYQTNQEKHLIQANIENLTSLWKAASLPVQSYYEGSAFNYCSVKNSDWPNRLWFQQEISQDTLDQAFQLIKTCPTRLLIPFWDIYEGKAKEYLESMGFIKGFEQLGMTLKLDGLFSLQNKLSLRLVSNEPDAELWTRLYPRSFGYRISKNILLQTFGAIQFYLAYHQNQPIGTAILYITDKIAGIHGVGVIPEMRKRGFAEEIMKLIIHKAIECNADYASLQASDMGKNIYRKLGFKDQFLIKNYLLSPAG